MHRPMWRHCFQNMQVIIIVVDNNDGECVVEANDELDLPVAILSI